MNSQSVHSIGSDLSSRWLAEPAADRNGAHTSESPVHRNSGKHSVTDGCRFSSEAARGPLVGSLSAGTPGRRGTDRPTGATPPPGSLDCMGKRIEEPVGLTRLGWREWVKLDEWSVPHIKAKVDTGARTSSLHAFDLEHFDREGQAWVRFAVHPWQASTADTVVVEAPLVESRTVKSSTGTAQRRPTVRTRLTVAGHDLEAEVTLTNRDDMGFRMLLGRQALRKRFLVDPGASYLGGRPPKAIRRQNRQTT